MYINRRVLFMLFSCSMASVSYAQFNHLWSYAHYSNNNDEVRAVVVDQYGNPVTAGSYNNDCVFDGDASSFTLTTEGGKDACVTSYAADGSLNWVIGFGSNTDDIATDVAVDLDGNIYVTGSYQNTMDVDPGAGEFILEAAGLSDVFLIKYSPDGDLIWAHGFGEDFSDDGKDLVLGEDGFLYLTGGYRIEMKFAGVTDTITLTNPGFTTDVFLAKFNLDGEAIWARAFGGGGSDYVDALTVWEDQLILAGDYYTTIDLDASAGTDNHTSAGLNDVFMCAYSTDGDFLWGHSFGGTSADFGHDLACDNDGNIYLTGNFNNTANFSSTGGTLELTSVLQSDFFLAAYDSDGADLWAISAGGSDAEEGYALAISASGPVVSGTFGSTVDFDPGPDAVEITATGYYDAYLVRYDFDGNLIEAGSLGSPYSDYGHALAIAPNNDIITGGRMQSPLDVDPGPEVLFLYGNSGFDGYIARYNTCIPYFFEETATICPGETYDFHGTILNEGGYYLAEFTTVDGCDSTFELVLSMHDIDITLTVEDAVLNAVDSPDYSYQWLDCDDGMTPIAGATDPVFNPGASGNYAVEITWEPCVEVSACFTVELPVGFSNVPEADWLQVAVPGVWNIQVHEPATVRVFDLQGHVNFEATQVTHIQWVSDGLPAGVYIVSITGSGYTDSRQVIIY